jgi:hypothetical protein
MQLNSVNFLKLLSPCFLLAPLSISSPTVIQAQCQTADFPGKDGVAAAPSRPVESSSPDPIQVGVSETEMGFSHSWVATNSSQNALTNLIKLEAWCNVEIRWGVGSLLSNTASSGCRRPWRSIRKITG